MRTIGEQHPNQERRKREPFSRFVTLAVAGLALVAANASPAAAAEKPSPKTKVEHQHSYDKPPRTVQGGIARLRRMVRNSENVTVEDKNDIEVTQRVNSPEIPSGLMTCTIRRSIKMAIGESGSPDLKDPFYFGVEQMNGRAINGKKPTLGSLRIVPFGRRSELVTHRNPEANQFTFPAGTLQKPKGSIELDEGGNPVIMVTGRATNKFDVAGSYAPQAIDVSLQAGYCEPVATAPAPQVGPEPLAPATPPQAGV